MVLLHSIEFKREKLQNTETDTGKHVIWGVSGEMN